MNWRPGSRIRANATARALLKMCASKPTMIRRGFLLPIVLVVVMMITFAVSTFAEQMLAEYRATHSMAAQVQASSAAISGLNYLQVSADQLRKRGQNLSSLSDYEHIVESNNDISFAIAAHRDHSGIVRGLRNESAKINLYGLPQDSSNILLVRGRLMALPKMTPQIADAIMDWIDKDEAIRPLGAEAGWYIESGAARVPSQEPIRDLAELLQVRGVTAELLFGEDANCNGWLDANEDDGDTTIPYDNANGKLDAGWSEYLTVLGQESNYRDDKHLKINVNQPNLIQLYDQLQPLLGPAVTTYIVALRLEGPMQRGKVDAGTEESQIAERRRTADDRLRNQLESKAKTQRRRTDTTRGGLDLGRQPAFIIRSMVDLIDQEVRTIVDGQQQVLKSPWSLSNLDAALASLEQSLTTQPEQFNRSRININHAPLVVLKSVPGIDDSRAAAIVAARKRYQEMRQPSGIGWLVAEGIFSLEQLREVAPQLTAGGDVFSGTSIGMLPVRANTVSQNQKPTRTVLCAGLHFTLDCSLPQSHILVCQDSMPFMLPLSERPRQ